jgi:hypothetical protein
MARNPAFANTRLAFAAVCVLALLCGCGTVNVSRVGGHDKVLLGGYDPVAYFTAGKAARGSPDIVAEHAGVTVFFADARHREMFQREPARYMPQYGGFCSNGAVYAIYYGGEPDVFEIIDGRLFIFGGERSRAYFLMDKERNLELADRYWETEGRHMTSYRLQSWKRQIFRHPHYKTNRELAAEYEARQGRKPGG